MSESVEQACETHLMGLLAPEQASGGRLFGIPSRHHDDDEDAILDCVIFKGKFDENELEGLRARNGTVTLTYASAKATPEQADAVCAAMEERIYTTSLWPQDIVFPGWASIEPDSTTEREDGKKERKRTFTVPMKALYIAPDLPFSPDSDLAFSPADELMFA